METFHKLRSKFLSSSTFYTMKRHEISDIPGIHLPYLVCLLQTAGYQLTKVECMNPNDMIRKGTNIVLSCGYSGQRCFLNYPANNDTCNCFIRGENSEDFFLEAVSHGNKEERWLVNENTSQYCLPFISDDLKLLCKTVIMELGSMIKENYTKLSGSNVEKNTTKNTSNMNMMQKNTSSTTKLVSSMSKSTHEFTESSTFVQSEISRDLSEHTASMSVEKSSTETKTEHKKESFKMSVVCSGVSLQSESTTQISNPEPISKSSPLPVTNVEDAGSEGNKISLIPKTKLGAKTKSASNLNVLGSNITTSKGQRSRNTKSTSNLSPGPGASNSSKYTNSQLKVLTPKVTSSIVNAKNTSLEKKPQSVSKNVSNSAIPKAVNLKKSTPMPVVRGTTANASQNKKGTPISKPGTCSSKK